MNDDLLRVITDLDRLAALEATSLLDGGEEPAFDRLTRLAAKVLGTPVALLSLVDDHRQFFPSATGLPEPWASRRETPLTHSFCKHVVANGEPFVVDDARVHPDVHDNPSVEELGVVAYAGVPLRTSEDHVLGALCAIDSSPRQWTSNEIDVLKELAASFVREVELRATTRECVRQSAILRSVLDTMGDGVIVADPDGRPLLFNATIRGQLGSDRAGPPETWPSAFGMFLSDGVTRCPPEQVPLTRALAGERVEPMELWVRMPGMAEARWHSVNASPIHDERGVLLGAVTVGRDVTERKRAEEQLAERAEALRAASMSDELTGLCNRRGFMMLGEQQLELAERGGRSVMLLFVDCNGMKQINDRLGHELGDQALCDTAAILRASFRSSDVVARLGGDEFVVMAGDASQERVDAMLARLQVNLEAHNLCGGRAYRLSVATGSVLSDPGRGETLDGLLKRADEAMYACKRGHYARPRTPPAVRAAQRQ